MVTNKDFESAVKKIARSIGRTCGEMVRYRRKHPPWKGKLDWMARQGTVIVASLGSNRWIVYLASKNGGQGSTIIRGKKREIVDFAHNLTHALYFVPRRKMKKLKKSLYGNVYGSSPRR